MMTERITELLDAIEQKIPSGGTVALRRDVRPDDFAALDELRELLTSTTASPAGLPEPSPSVLEQRLGEAQEKEGLGSASALVAEAGTLPHWEIGVLIGPCEQEDAEWLTELIFDVAQGRLGAVASLHRIDDIEAWSRPMESPYKWIPSTTTAEPSPSPESSRPVSTDREEDEQVLGASKARRAEVSQLEWRLELALAVIDDHDVEHPGSRLRIDYEQRVAEDETEARGQVMEP